MADETNPELERKEEQHSSNKRGRPPKLEPDAHTLGKIEGMAGLLGSMEEMARLLFVDKKTLIDFLNRHHQARVAWERGVALRNVSLRTAELKRALAGDTRILIRLGKRWLGQNRKRRKEVEKI